MSAKDIKLVKVEEHKPKPKPVKPKTKSDGIIVRDSYGVYHAGDCHIESYGKAKITIPTKP